jgi:hypothetical protein
VAHVIGRDFKSQYCKKKKKCRSEGWKSETGKAGEPCEAPVVNRLPSKHEALTSNISTAKKKDCIMELATSMDIQSPEPTEQYDQNKVQAFICWHQCSIGKE